MGRREGRGGGVEEERERERGGGRFLKQYWHTKFHNFLLDKSSESFSLLAAASQPWPSPEGRF